MKSVQITLEPEALEAAKAMRACRGIATPEFFDGPLFVDVVSTFVEDGFFWVYLKDATYAYPVQNIARLKIVK